MVGAQIGLPSGDVIQTGIGGARIWSEGRSREGLLAALRLEARGRISGALDAVVLAGPDGYSSLGGGLAIELPVSAATLRPAVTGGWSSADAPADERHGLGGPESLVGLRRGEWLGRSQAALELRLLRNLVGGVEAHLYGQVGAVEDAISRSDLGGRARFAAGLGVRINAPFGPLAIDGGLTEGGEHRFDLSWGQRF
jgi:hypothetical protein